MKMLSFTIHKLSNTVLFRCTGRLVSADGERLRGAVLAYPDARTIVLDLAEIGNIDASGVGILVSLREWSQRSGRQLKLMNLIPRVEHVLELTNLRSVFEVCSVPEMLELLSQVIDQARSEARENVAVPEAVIGQEPGTNRSKNGNLAV